MSAPAVFAIEQTSAPQASRARRALEGTLFIATWTGLGYLFADSSESYLLMGIPLTIIFQMLVRKRPLYELWVRDSHTTRGFARRDVAVTAMIMLAPAWWGVQMIGSGDASVIGWYGAALAGATAAAYALKAASIRAVILSATLPLAIGVGGNALIVGAIHVVSGEPIDIPQTCLSVLTWTAIYFPATFVIEEVAFRGAFDSHIYRPGDTGSWLTALFVSVLWGLWHLPVSEGLPILSLVASLVLWHCLVGVPLSFAWRRSGNLAGPALAHAGMDAVRNGLLGL